MSRYPYPDEIGAEDAGPYLVSVLGSVEQCLACLAALRRGHSRDEFDPFRDLADDATRSLIDARAYVERAYREHGLTLHEIGADAR